MPLPSRRTSSALYAALKAQLACDSGEVVSGIVDFVVSQHTALRLLSRALGRPHINPLSIALIVLNAVRCYCGVYATGRGTAIVAARRANERRAVGELKQMMPQCGWTELVFAWRLAPVTSATLRLLRTAIADARRTVRLARVLGRRYGMFRALRAVELVAYYRRYRELLGTRSFDLAVMSSHSNPWGIALNAAARQFEVPIVLVTHGMPVTPLARLDYDLALMECEASRRVYEQAGCRMTHVVIKGRKRDFAALRLPVPPGGVRAGIFLSKDPVEEQLLSCVQWLLTDPRLTEVLIRPHPINLWPRLAERIASLRDNRIRLLSGNPLATDLRACDILLAGNSTVLLDSLIAGCPSCYVSGLDHGTHDVQAFVADGLVCQTAPSGALDYEAIARFYQRPDWPAVLRRYAAVDRDEAETASAVRAALRQLAATDACERGAA